MRPLQHTSHLADHRATTYLSFPTRERGVGFLPVHKTFPREKLLGALAGAVHGLHAQLASLRVGERVLRGRGGYVAQSQVLRGQRFAAAASERARVGRQRVGRREGIK